MLYYVSQDKIEEFKSVARPFQYVIDELFSGTYREFNMSIPICNMWLALHAHMPNEKPLFLNESLRMAYRASFFQVEYVEKNKEIRKFIMMKKINEKKLVILAAHLVCQLQLWLDNLVTEANKNEIFDLYLEEEQTNERLSGDDKFKQSQENQKLFNKIIAQNLKETDDLLNAILYAIQCTKVAIDKFELVNKK